MDAIDKIYRQLSTEYNLPYFTIKAMCNTIFLYSKKQMKDADKCGIQLPYFGKFKIKKRYAETTDN